MLEDGRCLGRSEEFHEAPALAEERERLLGDDPEPLPSIGGIGVGIGGALQIPSSLGESCVRRDEGVLGGGVARLETARESLGERGLSDLTRLL